ncbi:MAG: hypothetical protein K9K32_00395 [Halanaerobiales bacterium]|nr:hypothetical protein [Halanaerobiales bacterium]
MKNNKIFILSIITIIVVVTIAFFLFNLNTNKNNNVFKNQITYLDTQFIFDNHPAKKEAEKELNEYAKELQLELETEIQSIPKKEHQKLINEYQNKLSYREQTLIDQITEDIKTATYQVAQNQEVLVVLKDETILKGGYDITSLVLEKVKESYN